jgi:DNA polymerase
MASRGTAEVDAEDIYRTLDEAREAAGTCTRCDLYRGATQTVFGEGPPLAPVMLVGEQPGDREDIEGRPFVGPAGRLLDRAMGDAGLDRDSVYLTNAVKHFKNEPRGRKRLHRKPNAGEIDACRWWLDLERRFVGPQMIVALGATALRGILGRTASVTEMRGTRSELADGATLFTTVHPSYLLRVRASGGYEQEYARFVGDLREVAVFLQKAA